MRYPRKNFQFSGVNGADEGVERAATEPAPTQESPAMQV